MLAALGISTPMTAAVAASTVLRALRLQSSSSASRARTERLAGDRASRTGPTCVPHSTPRHPDPLGRAN